MKTAGLQASLNAFRDDLNRRLGQRDSLEDQKKRKQNKAEELQAQVDVLRQVTRLFSLCSEYARRESKETIEKMVTSALQMVFQADHVFTIDHDERGDRTEADFSVSSTYGGDRVVKNDPRESRGGGVVDVISLALRVALLETTSPIMEGPLILDEPGKHVSEQNARQVAEFLNAVSNSFGRQVIMVTHNQHLADAGTRSFHVDMRGGESKVSTDQTSAWNNIFPHIEG